MVALEENQIPHVANMYVEFSNSVENVYSLQTIHHYSSSV